MKKLSAGIILYRYRKGKLEVMLVHPGGPFWKNKDEGVWSIPKGLVQEGEDSMDAARREFEEECGFEPEMELVDLGEANQSGKKRVHAYAAEGDMDPSEIRSNTFEMEWPKGSGDVEEFPEVDRAEWFTISDAEEKILNGQVVFIERLRSFLER